MNEKLGFYVYSGKTAGYKGHLSAANWSLSVEFLGIGQLSFTTGDASTAISLERGDFLLPDQAIPCFDAIDSIGGSFCGRDGLVFLVKDLRISKSGITIMAYEGLKFLDFGTAFTKGQIGLYQAGSTRTFAQMMLDEANAFIGTTPSTPGHRAPYITMSMGRALTITAPPSLEDGPYSFVDLALSGWNSNGLAISYSAGKYQNSISHISVGYKMHSLNGNSDRMPNLPLDSSFISDYNFSIQFADSPTRFNCYPSGDNVLSGADLEYKFGLLEDGTVTDTFETSMSDGTVYPRITKSALYTDQQFYSGGLEGLAKSALGETLGDCEIQVTVKQNGVYPFSLFKGLRRCNIRYMGKTIEARLTKIAFSNSFDVMTATFGYSRSSLTDKIKKAMRTIK